MILSVIWQILKIVILLGVLVIIHELGHFLVAKHFKMPVKEFAIGFGKKLWSKQMGDTLYSIRIFPLGGFVDIDDESKDGTFHNAPLYQKNLVLIAGVTVNLVGALVLAFIVLACRGQFVSNTIESFAEETNATKVGIQEGDKIVSVNGKGVSVKSQITNMLAKNKGESVRVEIERDNEKLFFDVEPYKKEYVSTGFSVNEQGIVTATAQRNINVNDKILSINSIPVNSSDDIVNNLEQYVDEAVNIEIERKGQIIETDIDVTMVERYYIGAIFEPVEDNFSNRVLYAFLGTGDFLIQTLVGLGDLITGNNQDAELMGIVGVSDIITKTQSPGEYFGIMASVSLSLAIINLLPLPLLDGGKIVIFTIEKYRKKEFNETFINYISIITLGLLILLTIYVTVNDIIRLV